MKLIAAIVAIAILAVASGVVVILLTQTLSGTPSGATLNTGETLDGRALAQIGAVTPDPTWEA